MISYDPNLFNDTLTIVIPNRKISTDHYQYFQQTNKNLRTSMWHNSSGECTPKLELRRVLHDQDMWKFCVYLSLQKNGSSQVSRFSHERSMWKFWVYLFLFISIQTFLWDPTYLMSDLWREIHAKISWLSWVKI